jgi:hypothetical protein
MKTTTLLATAALALALAAPVHAADLVAGPLSTSNVGDACVCEIVNVASNSRTIEIQTFDKNGTLVDSSGLITLGPGAGHALPSTVSSLQHCRFVRASPGAFRASMTCTRNGFPVTVPGR